MPFREDGSYFQAPGRAAVYSTFGEVPNITDLPRVKVPIEFTYLTPKKNYTGFTWPAPPVYEMDRSKFATREAREFLARRAAPDEKGYLYTAGYNKIVGYYSAGFQAFRFSGSSFNRKFKKEYNESEEKDIHRRGIIAGGVAKEAGGFDIEKQLRYERDIMELRIAIHKLPDSGSLEKCANGIPCPLCGGEPGYCLCGIGAPKYHVLSRRSRAKIKDKATAFYRSCPGRRAFVTLTFIDAIQDKAAVMVLNKFLTQLKKKFPDLQYLWVAERQNKNEKFPGNIHFHIIINRRLPVSVYNPLWVLEQYNSGLRATNKYGEQISFEEIKRRYKDRTIGKVLNPFDIKKVVSINNLSWYLTKYISKNNSGDNNEGFRCAAWHCSRGVSRLFTRTIVSPSCFRLAMGKANFSVNKETGECFYPVVHRKQFWQMVYINNKSFPLPFLKELEQLNKWLIAGEFSFRSWRDMPMVDDYDYRKFYISQN